MRFPQTFRFGYHGWTYEPDGALISATDIEGVQGFSPEGIALKPVTDGRVVQSGFRECRSARAASAGELGRAAAAGRKVSVCRDEVVRAPNLRHEVQLENLRRQLSGGISPAQRASRTESRTGLQRLRGRALCAAPSPAQSDSGSTPARHHASRYRGHRRGPDHGLLLDLSPLDAEILSDNVSRNIVLPVEPERWLSLNGTWNGTCRRGIIPLPRRRPRWNSATRFRLRMSASARSCGRNFAHGVIPVDASASSRKTRVRT